jgi:hypothetical protein
MLTDRLRKLETRQDTLKERLVRAPEPLPEIHPNVAHVYRSKVERLHLTADKVDEALRRLEAAYVPLRPGGAVCDCSCLGPEADRLLSGRI